MFYNGKLQNRESIFRRWKILCRQNNIPWRKEEQLKELGTKVIEKTKKDLMHELTLAGHHVPKKDRSKKATIIPWATKYGIKLSKTVPAHISESWVGKPKGKLQIAWERGLLNLNEYCIEDCSEKVRQLWECDWGDESQQLTWKMHRFFRREVTPTAQSGESWCSVLSFAEVSLWAGRRGDWIQLGSSKAGLSEAEKGRKGYNWQIPFASSTVSL